MTETDTMKVGKQRNIRLDPWIHEAVDDIAQEKRLTFTDVVNILLGAELEFMGRSKAQYDAKVYGLGRGAINPLDQESFGAVEESN
jgi:hypothetical protein